MAVPVQSALMEYVPVTGVFVKMVPPMLPLSVAVNVPFPSALMYPAIAMGWAFLAKPLMANPYFPVTFASEHCPHPARPRARTALTVNKPLCNIREFIGDPLSACATIGGLNRRLNKREWMLATGLAGAKSEVLSSSTQAVPFRLSNSHPP